MIDKHFQKYMCAVELEKPHMEIDPQQATDKVGHRVSSKTSVFMSDSLIF